MSSSFGMLEDNTPQWLRLRLRHAHAVTHAAFFFSARLRSFFLSESSEIFRMLP